ncbi:3D-(3,5/4)-trihydroxycyclohexane-1,2-dione acylhydrolase (decyclizing), partial [Enterococcus faecalis]
RTTYGQKITELKNECVKDRERLKTTHFKRKDFDAEIKNHFTQDILNDYADPLNTTLTQTDVLVHLNDFVEDDAIVIGCAG